MEQEDIRGKDLPNIAIAFADDDIIIVDGDNNGTRRMSKDTLLTLTAQNALAGNVASAFDPTRTSENPYLVGEIVAYNGKVYEFINTHYGNWNLSDVKETSIFDSILKNKNLLVFNALLIGNGSSIVYKDFFCRPSTQYIILINPVDWESPDGSFNKFGVYSLDDSGVTLATHYQKSSGSATPPVDFAVTITTHSRASRIRISFRGDVGQNVECVVVNNITNSNGNLASIFDSRKLNDSSTGYAYVIGDNVIHGMKTYKFIKNHSQGEWDESEVEELKVLDYVDNNKNISMARTILYGKDMSLITKYIPCYPSTRYCIKLTPQSWDSPIGGFNKFSVTARDINKSTLATYYTRAATESYHDVPVRDKIYFTTHANAAYIGIEFRGNIGVSVDCVVENAAGDDAVDLMDGFVKNADYSVALACSRYNVDGANSRDFLALLVTDSHNYNSTVQQAIMAAKESMVAQCLIHCGDFVGTRIQYGVNVNEWRYDVMNSELPCYFVMGNHEKGNSRSIKFTPTDEQLYNDFVKPLVSKNYLMAGEYTTDKCYYYHDFATTKTRLIVLDEYRVPLEYDETYWEPIAYNSTLPICADNTSYTVGAEVRVDGFTANAFRAKSSFNTGAYTSQYQPNYKAAKGYRYIDQEEAEWFLDTLYSTPNDYQVIVAMHNPFSDLAVPDKTKKFCQIVNVSDDVTGLTWGQNYMQTDFVADALNAFINSASFNETVSVKPNSNALYVPDYTVSKDFSNRGAVGRVGVIVGGHVHRDIVWKHPTYTNLYQITPMCASYINGDNRMCDIRIATHNLTTKERYRNSLTGVSTTTGRIALCKIGDMYTIDARKRDIEFFDPNGHE
jgi:hypothetical protein